MLEYCITAPVKGKARGKRCSKAKQRIVVSDQNDHRSYPVCQGQHSYVDRKGKVRPSSRLGDCAAYKELSNMGKSRRQRV